MRSILSIGNEFFFPLMVFSIPIIALVGGIITAIIRTTGQQRLVELAQRERIAAIERGMDPAKLPPLPSGAAHLDPSYSPRDAALRRSQGLMIGGLVTLAVGISSTFLFNAMSGNEPAWLIGMIPVSVGIALLLSAWLVRPRGNGRTAV